MDLSLVRRRVEDSERAVSRRRGEHDRISKELAATRAKLAAAEEESKLEASVQDILAKASALSWERTKGGIEALVDRALRAVFVDRDYKFVIEQETKRGTSSVSFTLVEGGIETDVWDDGGLGVADIVGFALRVAFVALYKPKMRPLIFWDEPFRFLSEQYQPNAARFVRQVADELGLQIVVVTHNQHFVAEADQVFRLEKEGGICRAVEQAG
jgi:DNA repair exonuclease SbcCD ATPase subunit